MLNQSICPVCKDNLSEAKIRRHAVYCGVPCRKISEKEKYGLQRGYPENISTGTAGAISELKVSIDLLGKGYEVFRALSQSCSADLAILYERKLLTIEVRSTQRKKNGNFSKHPIKNHKADIGALVWGNEIIYIPELPFITRRLKQAKSGTQSTSTKDSDGD
jgi:hypothetical protein